MEKTLEHGAVPVPQSKTKQLVMTALLAALCCVATMVVKIASPTGGYLNLGDAAVLLSAYLLGPGFGALAAGVGSALADGLGGYMAYVPGTLVIKALMALTAGALYRRLKGRAFGVVFCGAAGEIPMVAGYWLYDALLLKSFSGSAAGLPSNLVQAVFGAAAGTLLVLSLRKNAYVRREFPNL